MKQNKEVVKQEQIDQLSISERLAAPTPKFFIKLKLIGLALVAASTAILAAPVALPAVVATIASYMAVAGTVVTAVSEVTVQS